MKVKKAVLASTIVGAVVLVIAAVVIALSFIRVNPVEKNFGGYSRVEVLQASGGGEYSSTFTADAVKDGLAKSDFSIMQAVLEGKFSYDVKFKTEKVTEGDETKEDVVTLTAAEVAIFSAFSDQYVLRFYYDAPKSIKVGDEEIVFDTMLLRVSESNGEVGEMECVPYLSANIGNESDSDKYDDNFHIGSDYYNVKVLTIKMNTSALMSSLNSALEGLN